MKVYRDVLDATTGVVTKTAIFNIMEGTYNGKDMGERSITATIQFPTPIDFKAGDYVEFDIADLIRMENVEGGHFVEKFYIYTMPTIKKVASSMSAGNAFEHTVTFYPRQYELGCTQMRDLMQATNSNIIYTGYDEFSFYGGAKTLMDRIMCVLRERFGSEGTAGVDYWDYVISDSVNEERNTALEKFQFDFSGNSVMEAIVKLNDTDGINTKFWINERRIYVGFKRPYICGVNDANVLRTIPFEFKYGKTSHLPISTNYGNLFTITKSLGTSSPITRLYAYGSDRNLHRFYCSDRMKSGRYINKLMLPSFGNDGKTDYVDSVEGIAKFGIREGSKTFDEIYPSLRYFTYGDLRSVQYCIKIMGSGIESDTSIYEEGTTYTYPVARVQCYRVEALSGTKVNHLVESAPPVDLAVFCHATGKSVKVILYADKDGKTALQRQQEAAGKWGDGNYRVPAHTLHGSDYIAGSAFAVHDSGYECGHTHDLYVGTVGNKRQDDSGQHLTRDDWFVDIDTIDTKSSSDSSTTDPAKLKYKNEVEIHQINYTDTHWITDIFEFTSYDQTTFQRQGYSAYCYPRINNTYPNSQSDNTEVNAIVDISPVVIEDTDLNVSEGKQQDYVDVFLRDVGFQINEQTWFGDYTFLFDTCKISFLDGNMAGYELTVCKESESKKLADVYIPALLEDGSENPTFFEAADYMDATRIRQAYENGAYWRIKMLRTETDVDNYWLPNVYINASAGDHIVFLSIYMPDVYQRVAERRLEKEARKYLDANDDGDIQYTFDFDKVRMLQVPAFGLQLREGAIMRVVDDDLDIKTLNSKRTAFSDSVGLLSRKSLYLTDIIGEDAQKIWYTLEYRDFVYIKKNICTNYTDDYPTGWSIIPLTGGGLNPDESSTTGFVPSNIQITGYIKLPLSKEDAESIKNGDKEIWFSNGKIDIRIGEYSYNSSSHGDTEKCSPNGYSYISGIVDGIDVYYADSYKAEVMGLPSSLKYGTVGVKFHLENSCALKYYYRKGRTDYPIIAGWGEYGVRTKHTEDYTVYKANPYLMPRGTRFFCPAQQLTEFKANKYYEVTMDCENTTMPYFDTEGNRTLFALINNLGEGATWFVPEYTSEEITDFSDSKSWRRFVFKFTLEDTFNDSQDYYPAMQYISNGRTEAVSVRLLSIIEGDANGLADLNYADLNIDSVSIKFNDNTRQHGVMLQNGIEPSRRVANNATPMLREITATVKEESRASTWMQMMSRISENEILGDQIIKTQETLANAARRRYLDLLALKNSIFDPDGTCDQTFLQVMMMQVGADSMNFQLDKTRQAAGTLTLSNCRILQSLGAEDKFQIFGTDVLRHYVYTQNEPAGTWYVVEPANSSTAGVLSEFDLTQVSDDGKDYYYPTYFVAIKCAIHDSRNATWVCEPTQHKVNEEDEYYYFNWGILSPDSDGHYSLTETRGNAYMYGDNLICGKISTLAGQSYFDLTKGNFVLSDGTTKALSYENGVLTIGGVATEEDAEAILERLGLAETNITNAQSTADAAVTAAAAAQAEAEAVRGEYQAAISAEEQARNSAIAVVQMGIGSLQNQIDGEVTAWFLKGVPTLENSPAVDWTTDDEKKRHIGDTYTNMNTYEEDSDNAGKSWRFCQGNGEDDTTTGWHWHLIADSDAVKALVEAGKAQSTADGKSTTFIVQPSNYQKGDLWILQTDSDHTAGKKGDILTANADSTTYVASHWSKEVKYTDDTAATQAQEDAAAAKTAADNAQSVADAATTRLDNWAADGVISPTEKQGIKDEIARIDADKTQITNGYTQYSLGTPTDYNTAYTNYRAVLATLSAATPENITIPSDFSTKQTAYYTARTTALNAISKKAETVAQTYAKDAAQSALDNLQIGGRNLLLKSNSYTWYIWGTTWASGVTDKYTPTKTDEYSQVTINTKPTNMFSAYIGVFNKITNALWAGRKVTVSAMLYSSYQDTVKMGFVERKDSTVLLDQYYNHNADIAVEAQKWTQVSWSFESPVDLYADVNGQTPNALYVVICGSAIPEAGSYWRMKNVKIEFGNKPTDWTPAPEDVEAEITESKTYAKGLVDTLGTTLQNQIDGVVDSYFMEGAPTLTNAPAKDWTTDAEKARHEGDTYTDITKYVDDKTTPTAGHSWRWCKGTGESAGTWHWHEIADSDAVRALQNAAKAQDTADGKRRVFVTTPYTPYDIGDLWAQGGSDGSDILKCKVARATGNYVASDWESASSALRAAGDAQAAADAAKETLANIASDSIFTAQEKVSVRTEWASIQAEFEKNTANAKICWGDNPETDSTLAKDELWWNGYDQTNYTIKEFGKNIVLQVTSTNEPTRFWYNNYFDKEGNIGSAYGTDFTYPFTWVLNCNGTPVLNSSQIYPVFQINIFYGDKTNHYVSVYAKKGQYIHQTNQVEIVQNSDGTYTTTVTITGYYEDPVYAIYLDRYNTLKDYLENTVKLNENTDTAITMQTYGSVQVNPFTKAFSDYYAASVELQNAIAARVAELEAQAAIDDMEVGGENLCGESTAKVIYSDDNFGDNYSEYYKCVDLGVQLVANKNYVATNGGCTEQVTKAETGETTTITIPDEFAGSYLAVIAYNGQQSYEYMAAFDWGEVINVPKHTNGWELDLFVVLGGKDITVKQYQTIALPTASSKTSYITASGNTVQFTYKSGSTYVTPSAFSVIFKDTGTSYEYNKSLVATSNDSTSFDFTCGTTGSKTLQLLFPYNGTTYGAIYMFGAAFTSGYKYRVKVNYYKPTTSVGAYCVVTIVQLSPTVTLTGDDARSLLIDELLNDNIDTGDIANLSDFKWGTTDDDGENTEYYKSLSEIQVQAGTRPTKFQAYTEHLTNALKGSTDVSGGLLMTNVLMLKNESNKVTAGMSGLSGTKTNPEKVLLWGGGDYYDASNAANSSTYAKKDGTPITTLLKKDGTGKIGIFKIDDESVMVENGGVRTVITSGSVQKFADANNIGYTDYNKTFTSAGSTIHNCTIMERNFDGTQTGTIKIPVLNFGVSYYGSDELRGASARIKVTVQYNNKTEVIYNVYQSNTGTAGYQETKTTTFTDGTYSNTFAKLQSFKIELLDAITTYGSIDVNFSCYAGTAGNSKACVIANDGMMLSSGDGNRFIIKPTDDAMSIIADLPIVSTKEDVDKLVIGQLFTDSSGIVRRYSYDDELDGGTSPNRNRFRTFVSLYALRKGYVSGNNPSSSQKGEYFDLRSFYYIFGTPSN